MDNLAELENDFIYLKSLLKMLTSLAADGGATGSQTLSNGCKLYSSLPNGKGVLRQLLDAEKGENSPLWFVGFFGTKNRSAQDSVIQSVWRIEDRLVDELAKHPGILAYLTAETQPGGEWGNLVVYRKSEDNDEWTKGETHNLAVCDLAPKFYSSLKIHRGQLPRGLLSERFAVERTLFMSFNNDLSTVQSRYIKTWSSSQCSQECTCYPM